MINSHPVVELQLYLVVLFALAIPLGLWLEKAMRSKHLLPTYDWVRYAKTLILFQVAGTVFLYVLLRVQAYLPYGANVKVMSPDLAFNTAISFVTNTNWQAYAGETAVSMPVQMIGLAVQNYLSAATGIAVAFAVMRAFSRPGDGVLGDFVEDVWNAVVYVLLPLSVAAAFVLLSAGTPQTFINQVFVQGVEGHGQTIPLGPIASQEAIKMLGTNGGGYFNANSAHPFENPSPFTNWIQMLLIFLIPAALWVAFGRIIKDMRQGIAVLVTMTLLFVLAALALFAWEGSSAILEGKETRFGIWDSSLFATITTSASCGAVNSMHSSFSALGGMVPLLLIQLGEVIFGGVGSGFYGMLLYIVLTVFLAGLMVGRSPEYLGKKIGPYEMKMVACGILVTPILVLVGTSLAVSIPGAASAPLNPGPHGLTEILYAFSSAANNNGSAFAGLSANTPFYNVALGVCMWFGRFAVILPVLAIAGSLASKKVTPASNGTLPTHGPMFILFLGMIVIMVGALTYFPALALSPLAEFLGGVK